VATEPPGANCATGGAKITDGSGDTAYACNGATGPAGTSSIDDGTVGFDGADDVCLFVAGPVGPDAASMTVTYDATNNACVVGLPGFRPLLYLEPGATWHGSSLVFPLNSLGDFAVLNIGS
jgi:hypothetical protein